MKSIFFGAEKQAVINQNVLKYPWAAKIKADAVKSAEPYLAMSNEALWELMFSHTITRSWMVWSEGWCPECGEEVRMYFWRHDPIKHPWKVACPHCKSLFPKNDFYSFYRSGLDSNGVFHRDKANDALLFNTEHPSGELRSFGVDDGEGYCFNGNRWRFIGNYLIYSQWKKQLVGGVKALSLAYLYTGEQCYAIKAAIMLDRISDCLMDFDFDKEGLVYEMPHTAEGYVSYCIDSTTEMKELVLAYDRISEAIDGNEELLCFLDEKGKLTGKRKNTFDDIHNNIKDNLLTQVLNNPEKIRSNPPHTELTQLVIRCVLGMEGEELLQEIGKLVACNTEVDGVQGEKGLAGYSAMSTKGLALLLTEFMDFRPDFLKEILKRYPVLHQTFRFHIDTWCLKQQYYPGSGDGGRFAKPDTHYYAIDFNDSRMYTLLWELYKATGDSDFLRVLYKESNNSICGLPHDIMAKDPDEIQNGIQQYIEKNGKIIPLASINKEKYCLGILRGEKENYAAWIDYAYCGGHSQSSGMTIGLYSMGLDLMPDFGYPPVMFGGWQTPKALWYRLPSAHNTVMIDGKYQKNESRGKTTLWEITPKIQIIRVDGKNIADVYQFERTLTLIPIDENDFYCIDSFRVVGGKEHAKFTYSGFGSIETQGLETEPMEDYGFGSLITQTVGDRFAQPGWSVTWKLEDRYNTSTARNPYFRYTDFTENVTAQLAKAWIYMGEYSGEDTTRTEENIPAVITKRNISNERVLTSHFVSVLEPFDGETRIASKKRLPLAYPNGITCSELDVCMEITLKDKSVNLIIQLDTEDVIYNKFCKDRVIVLKEYNYRGDAELLFLKLEGGRPVYLYGCGVTELTLADDSFSFEKRRDAIEICWKDGKAEIISERVNHTYIQRNC